MLTFPSAPNYVRHPPQDLGELKKSTFFFGRQNSTQLTFLKYPKSSVHASGAWPTGHISYLGFYFDICEWRILPACAWTPALMFAPN